MNCEQFFINDQNSTKIWVFFSILPFGSFRVFVFVISNANQHQMKWLEWFSLILSKYFIFKFESLYCNLISLKEAVSLIRKKIKLFDSELAWRTRYSRKSKEKCKEKVHLYEIFIYSLTTIKDNLEYLKSIWHRSYH